MRKPAVLLALLGLSFAQAQTTPAPDGSIVPFSSGLPACATKCGFLFDVQGKCTPPNIPAVDNNCFCTDPRLTAIDNDGTTGVSTVCGPQSCTTPADLQAVKDWYDQFCGKKQVVTVTGEGGALTTSTSTSTPKSSGGGGGGGSWLSSHYKWVIMLVVIFFLITGAWIAACLLRRRYIKRKEREFEMRPPVAWGPHQLQGMTGGYNYGDGVSDANRGGRSHGRGFSKEAGAVLASPAEAARPNRRESKSLRKKR